MTQSNELKNNFQGGFIPKLFLVLISLFYLYLLSDIILDPTASKEITNVKVVILFFSVLFSIILLQFFEMRAFLVKLQSTALHFKEQANRDELTGLMNRNKSIHTYWIQQHFDKSEIGHIIVILDLDKFKFVNDQYDNACGDNVFQHISTLIKHKIQTSDSCCCIGEEEFALIFPDTNVSTPYEFSKIFEILLQVRLVLLAQVALNQLVHFRSQKFI